MKAAVRVLRVGRWFLAWLCARHNITGLSSRSEDGPDGRRDRELATGDGRRGLRLAGARAGRTRLPSAPLSVVAVLVDGRNDGPCQAHLTGPCSSCSFAQSVPGFVHGKVAARRDDPYGHLDHCAISKLLRCLPRYLTCTERQIRVGHGPGRPGAEDTGQLIVEAGEGCG